MAWEFRKSGRDEEDRKFDNYAHAVTVISETHRLNHDGFVFHSSGKITGVLDAGVQDILLDVPAATYPHLQRVNVSVGSGDVDIQFYTHSSTSAPGSSVFEVVTNRNAANSSGMQVSLDPTVTNVGSLMATQWIPPTAAGVGMTQSGVAGVNDGEEWILNPAVKYIIRITNNSGSTIDMRFEILWYEIDYGT